MSKEYQQTLDYLYSYVDFSLSKAFRYSADKFDLGRMQDLVAKLGHPEREYPIIHIAGTKGKGSVAALCQSALTAAGYQVGLYTSPHLHDYTERIQINGTPISHEDLTSLVNEIKPVIESIPQLTTFEITTALSFLYFLKRSIDAAVIEVGLGGRLDATNVVQPSISVITSISFDHTDLLGNTLAEIAGEKAGIIKPGVPVVMAPQEEKARLVIKEVANKLKAPVTEVGRDYLFAPISSTLDGQMLEVWKSEAEVFKNSYSEKTGAAAMQPCRLTIPLLGYHQVQNAATAYVALQLFNRKGLPVAEGDIQQGFMHASWPGRFEVLNRRPPVVVDSAHNRDSARKLRIALDDYFAGQTAIMVFGASIDKDIEGMFAELLPRISQVIATKSFHPRAIDAEKLVDIAKRFGRKAIIVPDVADALEEALKISAGEKLVLVTGSIFVVAGAREAWMARKRLQVIA